MAIQAWTFFAMSAFPGKGLKASPGGLQKIVKSLGMANGNNFHTAIRCGGQRATIRGYQFFDILTTSNLMSKTRTIGGD